MATILVTGAAKGIGRATALHLDRKGYTVFAGVRTTTDGDALCREASERLQPIMLDVTNADQIAQAAKTIQQHVGTKGLDALVNNAGIAVPAPLEFMPLGEFRRQMEVNLIGQIAVTQAMLPLLKQAKGRIVNISSVGGRIAGRMLGAYHASKFAMEALTDTLRQELAPWQINVISVQPGAIATPMWDSGSDTSNRLVAQMPQQAQADYADAIAGARKMAENGIKNGLPPERVAMVIEQALTAATPRTRYTVGIDSFIGTRILAALPDRLRDWVMARR